MGFETLDSLKVELEAAKETYKRTGRKDDLEYVNQVRYAIVDADIGDHYGVLCTSEGIIDLQRDPNSVNAIEAEGACFLFSRYIEEINRDDLMDAYNNLSGERTDCKGKTRWDLMENYQIGDQEDISIGGMIISGTVVYAEIWYDDAAVAYIPLN